MSKKKYLGIYLRGIAMGAADVVPGVSGGTIAFITGIYETLLGSIKSVNLTALKLLFSDGPKAVWHHCNGNFLLALGLGILTSILSLANLITYFLDNHPLYVWSFFFGLIVASSAFIARQISSWSVKHGVALVVGIAIAVAIAELKPAELSPDPLMVFLSGSIAICAMILPGISGSFILVLLGMYRYILEAISEFNLIVLFSFAAGCGIGLLSFANLLSWLLARFHDLTMTLLTGFLIGSLYLIWPWKQTVSFYTDRHGEQVPLEQKNVLPMNYQELTGVEAMTIGCVGLMFLGFLVVVSLEKWGEKFDSAT